MKKDRTTNFIKTYADLSDLMEHRTTQAAEQHDNVRDINKLIDTAGELRGAALSLIGFQYLGVEIDQGSSEFRTNRFFLDSMNLPILPSKEQLYEATRLFVSTPHFGHQSEAADKILGDYIRKLESTLAHRNSSSSAPYSNRDPSDDELDYLQNNGYLIIEDVIPEALCNDLESRLDRLVHMEQRSRRGGYLYGSGRMQRIYQLISKDEAFHDLLLHPLMAKVLGCLFNRETYHEKYFLSSFHGNILKPNAEAQIWHVDANVPNPLPPWIIRANASFVIADHTETNGATEVVPGSHKFLRKPSKDEAEGHQYPTKKLIAPKGSIIFWHGHLWHRSGANTTNQNRPAVLATYAASFFREVCLEENPYLYLSENASVNLPKPIKRLLGWTHGAKDYR